MDDEALLERSPARAQGEAAGRHGKPAGEGGDPLPQPGDEYRAIGRNSNKPEPMLCFILHDQSLEMFAYANLTRVRQRYAGGEQLFTLRFVEASVTEVHLEARGAPALAPALRQHRVPWIRELPAGREFAPGPVIRRITLIEDAA